MLLYSLRAVCYYFAMPKTCFMERKEEKLAQKRLYHRSYLQAYEYKLHKEGDVEANLLLEDKKEKFAKEEAKFLNKAKKQDCAQKNRVWEIDLLRAIVIFAMLIEHLLFDFAEMFPTLFDRNAYLSVPFFKTMYNFSCDYWAHPARIAFRLIGLFVLAILIGINTRFSKNNLKRGLILFGCGLLMSGVFAIGQALKITGHAYMNILVTYGLALLIYSGLEALLKKRFNQVWPWICLGIAVVILVSWGFIRYANLRSYVSEKYDNFWFIYNGYAGSIPNVSIKEGSSFKDVFEMIIGIKYSGDDWLCFMPTLGYLFLGAFIGHTLYRSGKSILHYFDKEGQMTLNEKFNRTTKGFLFFGHHTLWIYVLHQVVYIVLMLFVAGLIMGIPLGV